MSVSSHVHKWVIFSINDFINIFLVKYIFDEIYLLPLLKSMFTSGYYWSHHLPRHEVY